MVSDLGLRWRKNLELQQQKDRLHSLMDNEASSGGIRCYNHLLRGRSKLSYEIDVIIATSRSRFYTQ